MFGLHVVNYATWLWCCKDSITNIYSAWNTNCKPELDLIIVGLFSHCVLNLKKKVQTKFKSKGVSLNTNLF